MNGIFLCEFMTGQQVNHSKKFKKKYRIKKQKDLLFAELVTEEALLPTTVWPSEVFRIATGRARFGGGGGGGGSIPGEKNCGNFVGLFTVGVEGLD